MSLSNLIDIATDEKQTEDNWGKIIDVCEKGVSNPKECLKLILRRLFNRNPHIVLRSIILLDACVQNIGEPFNKEISSRFFVNEIKSKSKNIHQKALERLCFMTKKWSRELIGSEYDCINELNKWLQDTYPVLYAAGDDELNSRNTIKSSRKNVAGQEDDDLAKAIALSLKESEQKRPTGIYPSAVNSLMSSSTKITNDIQPVKKQLPKVRALYDFEAAEDNELTFKAGEIIIDVDTSNEHWWYGSNHRGQGMFPAQFVTIDLDNDMERNGESIYKTNDKTISQTNQQTESYAARPPTPVIDESKVDECLLLLEDADPTGEIRPDPPELSKLEAQCRVMGPLIDQELEKVDRHYNTLVELNRKTMESFQLYNELMTQSGMGRPSNYMWPQAPYHQMPIQDPSQMMPRMKEGMNIAQPQIPQGQEPMMFQPMNFFANMNQIPNQGYGPPQFQMNKNQVMPTSDTYPTSSNVPQSNQTTNYANSGNNNALTSLNYTETNMRSLPTQITYADHSFQSTAMGQPNFSYIQKDQTFPVQDGFN